jgi:hypothetical protein
LACAVHVPGGHAEQPAASTVPELDTFPKKPGAQTEHAETEVLSACEPAVVTPFGQATHPPAPTVPAPVTLP